MSKRGKLGVSIRSRRVRNVAYGAFRANGGSVLAAIEAVAPYFMEQAWDECERSEYVIELNSDGTAWEPVKKNPYRTAQ